MNQLGRGIATLGIWAAVVIIYFSPAATNGVIMIAPVVGGVFATLFVWYSADSPPVSSRK
jgi:hypothetical protein